MTITEKTRQVSTCDESSANESTKNDPLLEEAFHARIKAAVDRNEKLLAEQNRRKRTSENNEHNDSSPDPARKFRAPRLTLEPPGSK